MHTRPTPPRPRCTVNSPARGSKAPRQNNNKTATGGSPESLPLRISSSAGPSWVRRRFRSSVACVYAIATGRLARRCCATILVARSLVRGWPVRSQRATTGRPLSRDARFSRARVSPTCLAGFARSSPRRAHGEHRRAFTSAL